MKNLYLVALFTSCVSVTGFAAKAPKKETCTQDSFGLRARNPYGDTASASIKSEFLPRLNEFVSDCEVQKEITAVAKGNSIEVLGFEVKGLVAELKFAVQDFKAHTKTICSMEAGNRSSAPPLPADGGPIATIAYIERYVEKPKCEEPFRN